VGAGRGPGLGTRHGRRRERRHGVRQELRGEAPGLGGVLGNAAPCTADVTVASTTTVRITIDVIQLNGIERDDDHVWIVDIYACQGAVRPSEPPRVVTCTIGPGDHTVFVAKAMGDARIDLRVDS
jgi:hypothetical protein